MDDVRQTLLATFGLLAARDPDLIAIVGLSLRVSLSAALLAFAIGAPFGAALAAGRMPGRAAIIVVLNACLGLPPVVVGLVVYLALSRSGPLGSLGLLFTPAAMVVAQTCLGLPIVSALVHRALEPLWRDYADALATDGASPFRTGIELMRMGRTALVTVFLAAFGRAISEVGAILIVGGNIRGFTRTMTTAIALETSKGDLPLALALGAILIGLSLAVSSLAFALAGGPRSL